MFYRDEFDIFNRYTHYNHKILLYVYTDYLYGAIFMSYK